MPADAVPGDFFPTEVSSAGGIAADAAPAGGLPTDAGGTRQPKYGAMREPLTGFVVPKFGANIDPTLAPGTASAPASAGEIPPAQPVCYRHPDRVTYVTCQRCGRYICPECMRPAAVGVQCVECVQAASKAQPARRSILGHRVPGNIYVTFAIIGLCVLSFILQFATDGRWTQMFAFMPALGAIEPWRFLTSAFLHSTGFIGHILFNMLAFYQCGQLLERTLGHARFATLCLLTAIGGSVGYLMLAGGPTVQGGGWFTPVVGASGMVFGLFGALIPILRRAGSNINSILGLIAINAVLGFVVPGIAWQAHLGGFLVGLGMAYAYAHIPRNHAKLLAWVLPVGVVALLIALAVIRYYTTGWFDMVRTLLN